MGDLCKHSNDGKHTQTTNTVIKTYAKSHPSETVRMTYYTSCGYILKEEPVETTPEEVTPAEGETEQPDAPVDSQAEGETNQPDEEVADQEDEEEVEEDNEPEEE